MSENIQWHKSKITRSNREKANTHKSVVLWFTGLSGSGKSTIAHSLEEYLFSLGHQVLVLDGDNIRHGLCDDLGFSMDDRKENLRRVAELSKLFVEKGFITLSAFISPLKEERQKARSLFEKDDFFEIHVKCDLNVCEERDTKGYYKKARAGLIKNYTGINSPYDEPVAADLILNTDTETLAESVEKVVALLKHNKII